MTDAPKAGKRQTRAELEAAIEDLQAKTGIMREAHKIVACQLEEATKSEKVARSQIDDLKERLALAESENQRMRGYIARVQEDDVVREDLVKVGDPQGDHQLVPKRKPTAFYPPNVYAERGMSGSMGSAGYADNARNRPPQKHWVTK